MNFPVLCHTPLIAKVEKDELGGALEEAENALEQEENKVGNIQRSFFSDREGRGSGKQGNSRKEFE